MSQEDVTAGIGRIQGENGWRAIVHFPDGSFLVCQHEHATQEDCLPCVSEAARNFEKAAIENGLTLIQEPVR